MYIIKYDIVMIGIPVQVWQNIDIRQKPKIAENACTIHTKPHTKFENNQSSGSVNFLDEIWVNRGTGDSNITEVLKLYKIHLRTSTFLNEDLQVVFVDWLVSYTCTCMIYRKALQDRDLSAFISHPLSNSFQ